MEAGESALDKVTVCAMDDSEEERNVNDRLRTGEDWYAELVTVTEHARAGQQKDHADAICSCEHEGRESFRQLGGCRSAR